MLVSEDEFDLLAIKIFFNRLPGSLESINRRMLSRNQYWDLGSHMYGFGKNIDKLGILCLQGPRKELSDLFYLADKVQSRGDPVDEEGLREAFQHFRDECDKLKEAYTPYVNILNEARQFLLNPNEL